MAHWQKFLPYHCICRGVLSFWVYNAWLFAAYADSERGRVATSSRWNGTILHQQRNGPPNSGDRGERYLCIIHCCYKDFVAYYVIWYARQSFGTHTWFKGCGSFCMICISYFLVSHYHGATSYLFVILITTIICVIIFMTSLPGMAVCPWFLYGGLFIIVKCLSSWLHKLCGKDGPLKFNLRLTTPIR